VNRRLTHADAVKLLEGTRYSADGIAKEARESNRVVTIMVHPGAQLVRMLYNDRKRDRWELRTDKTMEKVIEVASPKNG
jgi:hypothetical protein